MANVTFNPSKHYVDHVHPCPHGHTPTHRYINSSNCIDCAKEARDAIPASLKAKYKEKGMAEKRKTYPSQVTVLTGALEAELQFLLSINLPDTKAQMDLINKALNHKPGAKWVE